MIPSDNALDTFRSKVEALQHRWALEDQREKISNRVTSRLADTYRLSDPDSRALFDRVLAEWVLAPDTGKVFDAVALIAEFRVHTALPALRRGLRSWKIKRFQTRFFPTSDVYAHSHALSAVSMIESCLRRLECEGSNR